MESPDDTQNHISSFTLFPKLPTELRLKIWRSTFTPRIVELRLKFRKLPNNLEAIHFNSYCTLPITLRINSESRNETLRHYHLSFESKDYYPNTSPQIYINFSLDTIYLDSQTFDLLSPTYRYLVAHKHPLFRFLSSTTKSNSNKIRYLALDEKIWLANPNPHTATNLPSERESILAENAKAIRNFKGLKELTIVHHGVNISVPCAYSYLRNYELHKLCSADRESRQLLFTNSSLSFEGRLLYSPSLHLNTITQPNNGAKDTFVRYVDKPGWSPQRKTYSRVLRGEGVGSENYASKKEFDRRYNEVGEAPIRGWELDELERGELRFFEIDGVNGEGGDFMDSVRRGCALEDRKALEKEAREGEKGWEVPVVRSVGLIRDGQEC